MAVSSTVQVEYSDDEKWSEKESENEDDGGEAETMAGNAGWADAMAKILKKNLPEDKSVVLTKYKKGNKRKTEQKEETKNKKKKADERHVMYEKNHVIPDKSTLPYEKDLMHVATRGVVKLFNAVNKHQKDMEAKLKKATTENKKSKVIESMNKTAFLDMLKSTPDEQQHRSKQTTKVKKSKSDQSESSSWSILQDDFMMGAKMKDWDRQDENGNKKDKANLQDHEIGNNFSDDDDDDVDDDGDSHESDGSS